MAVDANYVMQLGVVLASIDTSTRTRCRVHVLQDDVDETSRRLVERCVGDAVDIAWVQVPAGVADGFQTGDGITRVTYFRLLAEELLPEAIERVIYLDADLVVRDDLGELRAADLAGRPVGAVRSGWCPWVSSPGGVGRWRELGLESTTPYFNAGVLVLDLRQMRSRRLGRAALEYSETHRGELEFGDQEALNAVLAGDWAELAPRWNAQPYLYEALSMAHGVWSPGEVADAIERPGVVHYLSRVKPWMGACTHPARDLWFEALEATPWAGWRPARRTLRDVAGTRLRVGWNVLRHGSVSGRR